MLQPSVETGVPVTRQQKILDAITANPLSSYVFSGPPGVGKTTMLREVERLARAACLKNFGVFSRTAMQYQRDVTAASRGERVYALIKPSDFDICAAHKIKFAVFLDDVDKISGSEFIRLQLFELIDTVVQTRTPTTQLVLSTNMRKDEFAKFFGDAIAWRVFKYCAWVQMERGDA
jgi:ABC-type Fe3+/spermidine/putrescine transport system ATPase subunit